MTRNRERFDANEARVRIGADDLAALKRARPLRVVALAADWCGDVIANLPVLGTKPAMYVHGEDDRAIPTEMGVGSFRATWPNGPVVTLPGVGHFIQEDAPETACALVEQFIQMT